MNLILTVVLTTAVFVCQPKVKKQVDDSALAQVVHQNRAAIRACYMRTLKREPSLKIGKLVTTLEIEKSGRVSSVSFGEAARYDVDLGRCLSENIKSWTFPPSSADYQFRFPIVLSAN